MRPFSSPEGMALGSFIISVHDRGEPPPILFLGAGCSVSAGIPGVQDLLDSASRRFQTGFDSLEQLANYGPLARNNLVADILDQGLITEVHDTLAWLVARGYFDWILTTNWDQAIETSLGRFLGPKDFRTYIRPEISDESLCSVLDQSRPRVKLVKLHGDVYAGPLFKETELLSFSKDLTQRFESEIRRRGIIFLGYGLTEPRLFQFSDMQNIWLVDPYAENISARNVGTLGIPSQAIVKAEDGRFNNFLDGLCYAIGQARNGPSNGDSSSQIKHEIDETRRRLSVNFFSEARTDRLIGSLLNQIRRSFPAGDGGKQALIAFIEDPSAPGGAAVLSRVKRTRWLATLLDGYLVGTLTISGRSGWAEPRRAVTDISTELRSAEDIGSVILLDSVSFSGATLHIAREQLVERVPALVTADYACGLLVVSDVVRQELESAGFQVVAPDVLETGTAEVIFPWGWTRATSRVDPNEPNTPQWLGIQRFPYLPKPWGHLLSVSEHMRNPSVRILHLSRGERTSLHYHILRNETFVALDHNVRVQLGDEYIDLRLGQSITIQPTVPHSLIALDQPVRVLEVADGIYRQRNDIVRLEDVYDRSEFDGDQ
jgi:mannose-6-phosphate isomerase-like protein (cupin superfamily)